jgi:hypothetical protein
MSYHVMLHYMSCMHPLAMVYPFLFFENELGIEFQKEGLTELSGCRRDHEQLLLSDQKNSLNPIITLSLM